MIVDAYPDDADDLEHERPRHEPQGTLETADKIEIGVAHMLGLLHRTHGSCGRVWGVGSDHPLHIIPSHGERVARLGHGGRRVVIQRIEPAGRDALIEYTRGGLEADGRFGELGFHPIELDGVEKSLETNFHDVAEDGLAVACGDLEGAVRDHKRLKAQG